MLVPLRRLPSEARSIASASGDGSCRFVFGVADDTRLRTTRNQDRGAASASRRVFTARAGRDASSNAQSQCAAPLEEETVTPIMLTITGTVVSLKNSRRLVRK